MVLVSGRKRRGHGGWRAYYAGEGELEEEEAGGALVAADFAEREGAGFVAAALGAWWHGWMGGRLAGWLAEVEVLTGTVAGRRCWGGAADLVCGIARRGEERNGLASLSIRFCLSATLRFPPLFSVVC